MKLAIAYSTFDISAPEIYTAVTDKFKLAPYSYVSLLLDKTKSIILSSTAYMYSIVSNPSTVTYATLLPTIDVSKLVIEYSTSLTEPSAYIPLTFKLRLAPYSYVSSFEESSTLTNLFTIVYE